MLEFIRNLFKKEESFITVKVTRSARRSELEDVLKSNLAIIDRTCPECNNVRKSTILDGRCGLTDGKYNYMISSCRKCGAKWETKVKRV